MVLAIDSITNKTIHTSLREKNRDTYEVFDLMAYEDTILYIITGDAGPRWRAFNYDEGSIIAMDVGLNKL